MAKITRERIEKINKNCKNGFRLDVMFSLTHNEKQLVKRIKTSENQFLEIDVYFTERYRNFERTILPVIHFAEWTNLQNGMASSSGLGYFVEGEPVQRRNMKLLQEMTANLDDQTCLDMFKHEKKTKVNMMA